MQDFSNCGQCKNLWKFLDYSKIFSYPIKTWQKVFIPHENVAKYFGTPPCFTPPRYPTLKMTGPLDKLLAKMCDWIEKREFKIQCCFLIEMNLIDKWYTFSHWTFVVVYTYGIDMCYSVRHLYRQER